MRVLVTGIFDLLHVEHVRFLAAAADPRCHFFDTLGLESSLTASSPPGQSGSSISSGSSSIVSKMASSDQPVKLIVGIESDARVKKLKGEGRPVMGQEDRKEMLEGLKMVDEVMILPDKFDSDDDYLKLLREVKPDIYAVSENSPFMENKRRICEKAGVKCMVVRKFNPEYSTTKLIEKLLNC